MSITIVGSLNYDVVTTVSRIPLAGETIAAIDFATHNGGKGANQATACGRLRPSSSTLSVQMVGCIGNDSFGQNLLKSLSAANVNVSPIKTIQNMSTGVATILVEQKSGQNRIMVYPGANCSVTKEIVFNAIFDSSKNSFTTSTIVLQNEIPVTLVQQIITDIANFKDNGKNTPFIVYNPSPIDPSFDSSLYKYIDCLVVNSSEAKAIVPENVGKLITKDDDAQQALSAAKPIYDSLNLPSYLIITLGAAGCVYYDSKSEPTHVPAVKPTAPVIDTTGAGDTFLGALTVQLTEQKTLAHAVNVALAASAIAITRKGASDSIPTFDELHL